jgi:glutamate carboxypeptidase
VVTGRKGNLSIQIDIYGKAGHAAFAKEDKESAVLELAHKIIQFESLNDPEKGITANVGKIEGGIGPNTVPEHARASIDFRFIHQKDYDFLKQAIEKIVGTEAVPNIRVKYHIVSNRVSMPASSENKSLFKIIQNVGHSLGIRVKEEFRSGVSDANIIASENIPVIDGMGPLGGKDHSKDEYMIKKSLLQRSTLLTCSLLKCWESQNIRSMPP